MPPKKQTSSQHQLQEPQAKKQKLDDSQIRKLAFSKFDQEATFSSKPLSPFLQFFKTQVEKNARNISHCDIMQQWLKMPDNKEYVERLQLELNKYYKPSTQKEMPRVSTLIIEPKLLILIMEFANDETLCNVRMVCKSWNIIVSHAEEQLWKSIACSKYPHFMQFTQFRPTSWKQLYFDQIRKSPFQVTLAEYYMKRIGELQSMIRSNPLPTIKELKRYTKELQSITTQMKRESKTLPKDRSTKKLSQDSPVWMQFLELVCAYHVTIVES